jgi:hypothetical protein
LAELSAAVQGCSFQGKAGRSTAESQINHLLGLVSRLPHTALAKTGFHLVHLSLSNLAFKTNMDVCGCGEGRGRDRNVGYYMTSITVSGESRQSFFSLLTFSTAHQKRKKNTKQTKKQANLNAGK